MPVPPPTLSIALLFINYRTAPLLLAAVRSLLTCPAEGLRYRVLVVDNGSGDDSVPRLEAELPPLLASRPDLFEGHRLLPQPANLGFAAAVNRGLVAVHEPYAVVLNTDVEFRGPALPTLIAALRDNPGALLACPRLLRPDGSEQPAAVPLPTLWTELTNRSIAQKLLLARLDRSRPSPVPSVVGPCMALAMARLPAIGPLDERFFFFFEETDWCRRMVRGGFQLLWVPAATVIHLQGAAANTRPYRARIQFYDSRYRYFRKHHGRLALAILATGLTLRLVLNLLGTLLVVIVTLGRGRARDKLATYAVLLAWHLRGCPAGHGFDPRPASGRTRSSP
jgi:GT2 family glycosyltransferase